MLVECGKCEGKVDASVVSSYEQYNDEEEAGERFTFAKCPSCGQPILVLETNTGGGWDGPYRLYPPEENQFNPAIPEDIQAAFFEALACFKAKAFTATAIMCRKVVEGICNERGAKARNLNTALKEMKEKEIIESRLYDWADALRVSGNEAAHGVGARFSRQDASDIIEFTRALLEYVYTFREQFSAFKGRRAGASGNVLRGMET